MKHWHIENNRLVRLFEFSDFKFALLFINNVGEVAKKMKHHPDIHLFDWNKVRLEIWTHSKNSITDMDYRLADEINKINSCIA